LNIDIIIPVHEAVNAPHAIGCKITGIEIPIPPANKNAPENNSPHIEANLRLECESHMEIKTKKKIRNDGISKTPIVVKLYGDKTSAGKKIKLKWDCDKFVNPAPNVVVDNGVIVGDAVIVIYGGDCAFAISTILSAHIIEIIFEIYLFKLNIFQLQSSPVLYDVVLDASLQSLTIINISQRIINTQTNEISHTTLSPPNMDQ
jgi:hypothetical protein